MREIVLDTETTGMDPNEGDRIIEIGAVELENHLPTGRHLHLYINPERDVPDDAVAVHGITTEFLADKPVFSEVVSEYLDFVEGAKLIIHNAPFDVKFLNWELKKLGFPSVDKRLVVDTLVMARRAFPGSPANLDALCRRFDINNAARTLHGALLDSELLAEVYLELIGGRQHGLHLDTLNKTADQASTLSDSRENPYKERTPRIHTAHDDERQAHNDMIEHLKNPLWTKG